MSASLYEFYEGLLPSISERVPLAESCGIDSYTGTYSQNILLEDCLNNENILGASPLPTDNYDSFLTSPLSSSATSVFVNSLPNVSSTIYTIFSSDGITPSEKIYCTGTTSTPSNKLTTCTRGVSFSPVNGVIDETAGTGSSHSKNSRIAITDNINFSGKALAILNGSQATNGTVFYVGTSTAYGIILDINGPTISTGTVYLGDGSTTNNKVIFAKNGDANKPYFRYNESTNYWQWSDDGVNSYNFTTSSASGLSASSTRGIGITDSYIYINTSSTLGYTFDSSGNLYRMVSSTGGIATDSNGLYVDTSDNFTWSGTNTFSATTTVSGPFTVTATSTMATTTINGIFVVNASTTLSNLTIGNTSTAPLLNGNMNNYHFHSYTISTSDTLQQSADTERNTTATSYAKVKEIQYNITTPTSTTSKIRISFDLANSADSYNAFGIIYKNGVSYGTERVKGGVAGYQTFSEDLYFTAGDLIQLYYKAGSSNSATVKNFRIYYDLTLYNEETIVNTD